MIGYRVEPRHVAELTDERKAELLRFLVRVCGLPAEHVVVIDMLLDQNGRMTMEAHVKDPNMSKALGTNVIDVKTFPNLTRGQVPGFLINQYVMAQQVPEDGLGNAELQVLTNQRFWR